MKLRLFILPVLIVFSGYASSLTNVMDTPIEFHVTCSNKHVDGKLVIPITSVQPNQIVKLNLNDPACNHRDSIIKLFVYKSLLEYNQNNYVSIDINGDYFYQILKSRNSFDFYLKGIPCKCPVGGGE